MNKRLLILGAGRHQKNLIRRAKERGIEVVVSDYYPDAPGKQYATFPTDVDALDIEANIKLAKKYRISGVITTGTDQAVVTMAEVAAALGLPCYLTPHTAYLATNKLLMKEVFATAQIPRARHVQVNEPSPDLGLGDGLRYPVVVKPSDSQGQRGVRKISCSQDLQPAIVSAMQVSRSGGVMIEEFIDGYEITVNAWVVNGQVKILSITDRVTYNPLPAIGISFQHVFPSLRAQGHASTIRDIVVRIVRCYNMNNGPLYVQMLVHQEGVAVVEAACRVGGGHEESSVPLSTGVGLRDRLIDLALTGKADDINYEFDENRLGHHVMVTFLLARPGIIQEENGFAALLHGRIIEEGEYYVPPGYRCHEIVDGQGRVGYFIVQDKSRAGLMQKAQHAYANLQLCDGEGKNLLYWPEAQHIIG